MSLAPENRSALTRSIAPLGAGGMERCTGPETAAAAGCGDQGPAERALGGRGRLEAVRKGSARRLGAQPPIHRVDLRHRPGAGSPTSSWSSCPAGRCARSCFREHWRPAGSCRSPCRSPGPRGRPCRRNCASRPETRERDDDQGWRWPRSWIRPDEARAPESEAEKRVFQPVPGPARRTSRDGELHVARAASGQPATFAPISSRSARSFTRRSTGRRAFDRTLPSTRSRRSFTTSRNPGEGRAAVSAAAAVDRRTVSRQGPRRTVRVDERSGRRSRRGSATTSARRTAQADAMPAPG